MDTVSRDSGGREGIREKRGETAVAHDVPHGLSTSLTTPILGTHSPARQISSGGDRAAGPAGDKPSLGNKAQPCFSRKNGPHEGTACVTAARGGGDHQFRSGQQTALSYVILDSPYDTDKSQPNRQQIIAISTDL